MSRLINCACVTWANRLSSSATRIPSYHSEFRRTSNTAASVRSTRDTCSRNDSAFASISAGVSTGRVSERPVGSPTRVVRSPSRNTT